LGLLRQVNNHPIRPSFLPRLPRSIEAGRSVVTLAENLGNTWNRVRGNYRVDFGSSLTSLDVAHGIDERTQISVEASDYTRTRSYLDPITEWFHDLFRISQNGRERFPKKDNVIEYFEREDFEGFIDDHSGSVWRTYGVGFQHELLTGIDGKPSVAVGFDLRFLESTQGVLDDDDPWSAGVSLGAAQRLEGDLHAYFGLGWAWHGPDRWYDEPLHTTQLGARLGLEWHYAARMSYLLQYAYSDDVTLRRPPWNEPAHEVLIGWAYAGPRGSRLEIGILENMVIFGTSPDFGFHLALSTGF
jgi:hypothetical protein